MKIQHSKLPVFSVLAVALLSCPLAQASPPTPHEVAERIHDKVRGAIFRITRIVEGATNRDLEEDPEYDPDYEPEYEYREERYYHEAPPPPPVRRYSEAPPPRRYREHEYREYRREYPEEESTGITRGDGTEYYTPDLVDPNPSMEHERDNEHVVIPPSSPPVVLKSKDPAKNKNTEDRPQPTVRESAPPIVPVPEQKKESNKPNTTASVEPARATAVPNKSGFVYPPGVKQEPANMLDVRGLNSGQKARDPRTGQIFLVP